MLKIFKRLFPSNKDIVKNCIEKQSEQYLSKVYSIHNGFYMSFIEGCIYSSIADAYDYFLELRSTNNVFSKKIRKLTNEKGQRFLKLMTIHHSIKMILLRPDLLSVNTMKKYLIECLNLTDKEIKMFDLLYACASEYYVSFSELFATAMLKYVLDIDCCGQITIAFIENFCYNSYNNMMKSFTNYLSLNQRLKSVNL